MKKTLILIIFFRVFFTSAQDLSDSTQSNLNSDLIITVYSSSEDYLSGNGEIMGEYLGDFSYSNLPSMLKLDCKKDSSEFKLNVSKYWGFSIGKNTFRIGKYAYPYCVYSIGKLIYYESGIAHLRALDDGFGWTTDIFSLAQFSIDLESKFLSAKKASNLYKKYGEEYRSICECIKESIEQYIQDIGKTSFQIRANRFVMLNRKCMKLN